MSQIYEEHYELNDTQTVWLDVGELHTCVGAIAFLHLQQFWCIEICHVYDLENIYVLDYPTTVLEHL